MIEGDNLAWLTDARTWGSKKETNILKFNFKKFPPCCLNVSSRAVAGGRICIGIWQYCWNLIFIVCTWRSLAFVDREKKNKYRKLKLKVSKVSTASPERSLWGSKDDALGYGSIGEIWNLESAHDEAQHSLIWRKKEKKKVPKVEIENLNRVP